MSIGVHEVHHLKWIFYELELHFTIHSSKKETPRMKICILFEYPGEYRGVMGFVGIPTTLARKVPPHFFKFQVEQARSFFFGGV